MLSFFWLAIAALVAAYFVSYYRRLTHNIALAKDSGIPYIVSPVYGFDRAWLVTHRLFLPSLHRLPKSWTHPWIQFAAPDWPWDRKYDPFKEIGSDMFLIVSPSINTLYVADPDAITQITTRRNDFPKPIEIYGSVDLFGKNVVSTEGSIWRHHRKITSPPFTEKNNHLVWSESLHQGQSMLTSWVGASDGALLSVANVAADTMRVSLHVISRAGFGVRLLWPHEEVEKQTLGAGHTMTYKDALSTLLEYIIAVMLLPRWFIAYAPFKTTKIAYESYVNWKLYMEEIYQAKKDEVKAGESREGMDLMGALVKGAGMTQESLNASSAEKGTGQMLTDDEILGNAFVFILAGHETAANTLHFSMIFLAMSWSSQERLHKDLDDLFGDRPVSEWDYERDVPKLFGNMVGAIMNEELRLMPPVIGIPKSTPKTSAQTLTVSGRRVIVPAGCYVTLDTVAVHRNPKYWPTLCGPNATEAEIEADLDSFKPERWLLDPSKSAHANAHDDHVEEGEEDIGGPQSADTASTLYRPARGAYVPFSDGYRSCLGRRFAQVEILAVLAVMFREYSVEFAVDEFADEAAVAQMDEAGRQHVWGQAKDRANHLFKHGMGTIITNQLRNGKVPLKFVKRGGERFKFG